MADSKPNGRINQRRRTRKELLLAASRLLKKGRKPSMDEIAEEALVSRATAYRYFPDLEALLVEAPLDGEAPDATRLFANDESADPEARIDKAEAALHEMTYRNEAQLRLMISYALNQAVNNKSKTSTPVRQNRRCELIEAALAPARDQFDDEIYEQLRAALSLFFGPESMLVFRDVLPIDEAAARRVKSWAIRNLVRAALKESKLKS